MKMFSDNARVCFLGDSITHNNGFVSHITRFYHKNYPEKNVKFYNCGVSGGTLDTLLNIFDEDIMVHKPTHAVIMIGVNDSRRGYLLEPKTPERYEILAKAFEKYKANMAEICSKLWKAGAEIIMCTPVPYDEYKDVDTEVLPGGLVVMSEYANFVRDFAKINCFPLCDYYKYMMERMQKGEDLINPDRVHPNELGQYYMAKCFLEMQGVEIGEKEPFPDCMGRWRELIQKCRDIRAAEWMVINDYSLSREECIKKVEKCLEENDENWGFRTLCLNYLRDKPCQGEMEAEIDNIMEKGFSF